MKKTIVMTTAAFLLLLVFTAVDVSGTDPSPELWVNGHPITGDTTNDTEHWSYVASTNTLTLNNATLNVDTHKEGDYASPIYYSNNEGTLKILLIGNNTISKHDGTASYDCGIYSNGSIDITGNGTLTIADVGYYYGISVNKDVTIRGGDVTVNSFVLDVKIGNEVFSNTAFTMLGGNLHCVGEGNIGINGNNGGLKMIGGTIELENNSSSSEIYIQGPFDMTGGTVTFNGWATDKTMINTSGYGINLHDAAHTDSTLTSNTLVADCDGNLVVAHSNKTVAFDALGGVCESPEYKRAGVDGKLSSLPVATLSGYDLVGWFTEPTDGEEITTDTVVGSDMTAYAHWSPATFTITLNKGTEGTTDGSATVQYHSSSLTSRTDAKKTGYDLTGYYTAATDGIKVLNADGTFASDNVAGYITDGKWTYAGDCTLYSQWSADSGGNNISTIGGIIAGIIAIIIVAGVIIIKKH